jgi:hypothetical protein
VQPWLASLIAGLTAGALGAYVGIRVALAGLTTWKDIRDGDIRSLQMTVDVHGDDILTLDYEVGTLMSAASIPRARRQRVRD